MVREDNNVGRNLCWFE